MMVGGKLREGGDQSRGWEEEPSVGLGVLRACADFQERDENAGRGLGLVEVEVFWLRRLARKGFLFFFFFIFLLLFFFSFLFSSKDVSQRIAFKLLMV